MVLFYLPYLCLLEFLWMIGNHGVACTLYGTALWRLQTKKSNSFDFSPILRNYVILNFFASLSSLVHSTYMAIFWRPVVSYNAYIMFFTGWVENSWLPMVPTAVFFITVERCLCLNFSMTFGVKRKRVLYITFIIICVCILIINGSFLMLEIPDNAHTDCYVFACMCKKYNRFVFWIIKNSLAILNLTSGLYFLYTMNAQKISEGSFSKKNNILVLRTILASFLFDLFPGTISFVLPKFYPIDLNSYGGAYVRFLTSFEALYSAIIYERIIRSKTTVKRISVASTLHASTLHNHNK